MPPKVIFLDDNQELRQLLQDIVEARLQIPCAGFGDVPTLKLNGPSVFNSQVIILDIELGFKQASGLEAYTWLLENNYKGHIFFLTGHGHTNPLVQKAVQLGATIWEKPIGSAQIISDLQKVLPSGTDGFSVDI